MEKRKRFNPHTEKFYPPVSQIKLKVPTNRKHLLAMMTP